MCIYIPSVKLHSWQVVLENSWKNGCEFLYEPWGQGCSFSRLGGGGGGKLRILALFRVAGEEISV